MRNSLRSPLILWPLLWAALGAAAGVALVVTDVTGHLPPLFAPPLLALAGAVGGVVGGALFAFLRRRLHAVEGSGLARAGLGALSGAIAGGLLYFAGLGALLGYCLFGGAAAGVLAAVWTARPRNRDPGPG